MSGRAEPGAPKTAAPAKALAWLLLALALLAGSGGVAAAQAGGDTRQTAIWDGVATQIDRRISDPGTTTPELEALREQLVRQRDEALAAERTLSPPIDDLNGRLKALGDPPGEGITEAPEIAERRAALTQQLTAAKAPVLEAQEAVERNNAMIAEIDRIVRGRFSAELLSRGPSPVLPQTWTGAIDELSFKLAAYRDDLMAEFTQPENRNAALRRLPANLVLLIGGIVVAFLLRRWLGAWVDRRLESATSRRSAAWIFALRNVVRLIVPVVGAGLIFAAFDPDGLVARAGGGRFFELPRFVAVMIAAGWLAGSLFAGRVEAHRLVPTDDANARRGAKLTVGLGAIIALALIVSGTIERADLSVIAQSVLYFPLIILGALGLWGAARIIETVVGRLATPATSQAEPPASVIAVRFLGMLVKVLKIVAVAAPLLAVAGYLPAAAFLVFRTTVTLGLLGGGIVIFDLLNKTAVTFLSAPKARPEDGGLIPVVVAAIVVIAAIPLLALTWGARPSDLADVWSRLNNGTTLGGMRLSVGVIVTFVAVFALGSALTRLLQTVLRGTVLPRTRLDAGGRNAILAGVGYLGFGLAGLAAVGAAGLDLSNLAIVAGALSVGIGFGLQNVVSNFVSGIILLVERPVKEGDWIEVGAYSGYVRGISVRSTEIETFDRASVILPNSDLIAGTVLNRTHKGMSGRLQVPVSVTYDADPKKIEAILIDIAETHPLVLEDPAPRVLFLEFGADSMNFELRCWLRDVNFSLTARSDMNFEIASRFAAAGIRMRFYGRDLPEAAPVAPSAVALQQAVGVAKQS